MLCYLLRCERAEDESNKLYYPYKSYPLQAGDKFVILGIDLPDVYVKAASQRLLRAGKEYLSEVDHMKHTYSPKIDEIAMARQHDEAIQSRGISLHDTIKEGMLIRISDEDLFNEELHITIDTLTIKEGESLIPSYEITLKEAKEEGTLERMQNKIDAIASGNSVNHAGGTIVNLQGNYLKKDTEDAATALISFLKGLLYGNYKPGESGGALKEDGSAEFDSATIRKGLNIGEFSSINRIGDAVLNSISLRNLFQIGKFSSGESGGQISDDGAAELASLLLRGALEIGKYSAGKSGAKIGEDGAAELLSVLVRGLVTAQGIQSPGFSTGALGTGLCLKMDENGDSYIEVDRMLVRKVAEFIQLVIQEIKHVGGQIVLTPASMKCIRVEDTGSAYRCYFEATDGEKTVENQFVSGDQARAQTFNVKEGMNENVKNTYYWRLVTGVGDNYIDLSKTDCDAGSTVPAAGDEIVQLGNRNDVARQAAIILSAYGNDAPYFKMYRGINSYKLEGKEFVNLSREDVMIISDNIKLSTGETVKEYINGAVGDVQSKVDEVSGKVEDAVERLAEQQNYIAALQKIIEDLQDQIDGVIESHYGKTDPTTSNYPANEWTTEEQKQAHSNDTYTNLSTGKSWKWVKDGDTWKWNPITDTATEKALAAAAKAQDTADGKRRVFVSQPATGQAYDVGDLWVNATYGETYKNDLLRCKTAKKENEAFSISHWELASRYTDDTKANEAAEAAREAAEAANAAQEAADEAAATAGEAKTEAQAANTELDNLKSDGTISPVEKTALKQQHADIKAEHGQITSEAGKYSISVTDYEAAYKKADAALTKYTASTPEYITVESDYSDISAYYSKRQTILDTIAAKAKEASDAAKKAADDAAAKADEAAESASEAAQKAIEAKTAADNAATAAKNAQSDADEANSMLSDIANDNKFTAQEKQQTKKEWDVIVSEKPKNDASADKFGVSKTAYGSAYTALSTYITPLLSDLSSTSNITGTEFRAKFKAYYDARTDLLNAISAKAKELADNAQEAADAAAENASQAIEDAAAAKNAADKAQADVDAEKERMDEWAADGKFSPSEKKQLKEELARIDGDKAQVTDGYTKYGLGTPTAYNTAYTNYRTAINGVVSSSSETVAIPSDFATKRTAYYTQKSAALTAISDAAKAYADKVVAGIEVGGRNYAHGTSNEWTVEKTITGGTNELLDSYGSDGLVDLQEGDQMTFSFDYEYSDFKSTESGNPQVMFQSWLGGSDYTHYRFGNLLNFENGSGIVHVVIKGGKTNSKHLATDILQTHIRHDRVTGKCRLRRFKAEKGTVATSWTPAIEDVNGMIEDAQKAADDAAEAAKNAQVDATNANKELANIKSDNLISPIEKTALKQQQADIRSEYGEIAANAARYAVSTTAYKSAYDLANAALTKYTASSPEYITVGSDYANISAYYDARKTILDAIAAAAKKAADDATNKANQAVEDAARAGHYYLDLDNDGGPVSCDASGNVTGGFPSSKATVYYGTEPDTGWAFTGAFSGCSGSVNSSTGQITVTGVSADTGTVTVTAKKNGKTDLSAVFSVYKVKAGADGADGTNGMGIKSITNKYAVSASNTTAPTSWSDTVPTMTATNRYLWNYEIVTYTNNTTSETKKRVIGAYGNTGNTGATGATGVGIKSITEYYLASSSSSGVTTSTSGWTTSVQATSSSKKYLWNYEVVTYTNDTKYTSSPVIIGTHGDDGADGKGIKSTAVTYQVSTSGTTPPTGTWNSSIPSVAANQYLWTRTVITYTDNTTSTSYSVGKMGANGAPGKDGADGKPGADGDGIVSVSNTYQIGSSGTTAPTGSWSSTVPSPQKGKYLWTKTVTTYKKSDPTTVYSVSYYGTDGTAAKYVRVAGDQVFIYANNFSGNPTPTSITLTATLTGTSGYQWSYKQAGQTSFTNISGATSQTYALAHNNSTVWGSAKSVTIRCTSGGVYDEMTIAKVSSGTNGTNGKDGTNGTNGKDGAAGKNGADAYTIILGNESHAFQGTTSAAIAASTKCEVIAYKGATRVAATIGTITGAPSGMSTSISSNGTTSASFTVSVTSSLTTGQGVLTVPITVDGKSFTKNFSFSVAFKGNTGATGATGHKGDAAVFYTIEPSANVVKKSWDNKLTPTSVTCTKYKQTGSNARATTTEKTLKYQRVGTDSSVQTAASGSSVTVSPTSTTTSIKFWLYDGSNIIMMQEVPVVGDAVDVYTKVHAEITAAEGEIGLLSTKVTTVTDSVTGLEKEVETNTAEIKSAKGQISSTASQVSSLGTRVSTVEQTASGLTTTVNGLNGKVSKLEQTDSSLTSRITSAEGKVSTIEQKVSSISLKVDGIEPVNLFRDGSFESGYNTFRASGSGKDDVEVGISANGKVGKNAMMVKWPGKRTLVYIEQDIRVVENSKYTLALWVYTNKETSAGHDLVITAYNKNGSSLSISDSTVNLNVPKTSWTRFVHTFTVPTGTEYVSFYIRGTSSVDADTLVYYDGVMLLKGDYLDNIPSYFIPNDSVNGDTLLSTGIDIENKKVIVTSDQFVIKNNDGEVTASVNEDGVLSVGSGEFSGFIRTIPRIITKNTGDNGDVEFKDNYYQISLSNLYKGGFIYVDVESNSYAGDGIKLPLGLKYAGARVTIVNKYPAKRLIITTRHEALDPGYGDWSDDENNAMRLGGVQISHVEMGNVSTQGNNRFVELLAVPYYLDETIGSVKYQGQVEWVVLNNQEFTTANNTTGGKYAKFK